MPETVVEKAGRLLVDGRVSVVSCEGASGFVAALVVGDSGEHQVHYTDGWSCTCPCVGPRCSHIEAVRRVTRRVVR